MCTMNKSLIMEYFNIGTIACSLMMVTVSIDYFLRIVDYCTKPSPSLPKETSKTPLYSEEEVLLSVVKTLGTLKEDLDSLDFGEFNKYK